MKTKSRPACAGLACWVVVAGVVPVWAGWLLDGVPQAPEIGPPGYVLTNDPRYLAALTNAGVFDAAGAAGAVDGSLRSNVWLRASADTNGNGNVDRVDHAATAGDAATLGGLTAAEIGALPDNFSLDIQDGKMHVADWLQNGYLALRYDVWRIADADSLGMIDGAGWWFDVEDEGLLVAQSTNAHWQTGGGYANYSVGGILMTGLDTPYNGYFTRQAGQGYCEHCDRYFDVWYNNAGTVMWRQEDWWGSTFHWLMDNGHNLVPHAWHYTTWATVNGGTNISDLTQNWFLFGIDDPHPAVGEQYPDMPTTNATLTCTNRLLSFVPAACRASSMVHADEGIPPTTNTVKLYASRDLGATWSEAQATVQATMSVSNFLIAGMASLTNQPSGSNVTLRAVITNSPPRLTVYGLNGPCK